MSAEDTTQVEFYSPWPNLGKKLSEQLGEIRTDTASLNPIVRGVGLDAAGDFSTLDGVAKTAVQAYEIGQQDFHNRFRTHYNKTDDLFEIAYNNGTTLVPNWYTTWWIDKDGQVTQQNTPTTASNVGGGQGWFKQKVGVDLEFKSITATSPITIVNDGDSVDVDGSALVSTYSSDRAAAPSGDAGVGVEIILSDTGKVNNDLPFKALKAGPNVVIRNLLGTAIEIESTAQVVEFYGIAVQHSDSSVVYPEVHVLKVNVAQFYLTQQKTSPSAKSTILNFRGNVLQSSDFVAVVGDDMTGQLAMHDGSVGTPSIGFTDDTNTGIRRRADDDMAFVSGGADIARVLTDRFLVSKRLQVTAAGNAGTPDIVWFANSTTGLFQNTVDDDSIAFATAGVRAGYFDTNQDLFVTNEIKAGDGSAATPAYSFDAEIDTGMYSPATNELGFSVNTVNRLNLTESVATFLEPLQGPDGSIASGDVTFSFANDPDTGVYRRGANQLGFATEGVARGYFDSTANSGVFHVTSTVTAGNGSVGGPSYNFASDSTSGMFRSADNEIAFSSDGGLIFDYDKTHVNLNVPIRLPSASDSAPGLVGPASTDTGIFFANSSSMQFAVGGSRVAQFTATKVSFNTNSIAAGNFDTNQNLNVLNDVRSSRVEAGLGVFYTQINTDKIRFDRDSSASDVSIGRDDGTGIYFTDSSVIRFTAAGGADFHISSGAVVASTANLFMRTTGGSVGVPALAFFGDTDTGLWQNQGNNDLHFTTGGVDAGYFTSHQDFYVTKRVFTTGLVLGDGQDIALAPISHDGTNLLINNTKGHTDFTGALRVAIDENVYSQFGPDTLTSALTPSDARDSLVVTKIKTDTSGVQHAGLFSIEINSDADIGSSQCFGINAFSGTVAGTTTTGTRTTLAGTGVGGRYSFRHRGAGTIAFAGGISSGVHLLEDQTGVITDGYGYLEEGGDGGGGSGGSGSITNYHGLWIKTSSGNVTAKDGITIDDETNTSDFSGIRSTITSGANKLFINHTGTAASNHTGEFYLKADLHLEDKFIRNLGGITFRDTAGTIAGIQNQNLLDKAADESITGEFYLKADLHLEDKFIRNLGGITFRDTAGTIAGIQNQNLLDKTATESISGLWKFLDRVEQDISTGNTVFGLNAASSMLTNGTAVGNTVIGAEAGLDFTNADNNTIVGHKAGGNLTGSDNVMLGQSAGFYATSSVEAVCIGVEAGQKVDRDVVAIGYKAGEVTTTRSNVFVGHEAGRATSTGGLNVYIGWNAAPKATVDNANVCIGAAIVPELNGGIDNTIIGSTAGNLLTTGDGNSLLGSNAGNEITTGSNNTIIGSGAGSGGNFSTGVMVGFRAGRLATGSSNTLVGQKAGEKSTGFGNTYIGAEAGRLTTTGAFNSAFGVAALENNVTGDGNTVAGYRAMRFANAESDNNVAIGFEAMGGGVGDRDRNIAIGRGAGSAITTGDDNIIIGYLAGNTITTGGTHTLLGNHTGTTLTAATAANVFLGFSAGRYQAGVSDRLIIDNRDQSTAAAELTDALVVGDFNATVSSQNIQFNANTTITHSLMGTPDEITATSAGVAASLTTINTEVTTNGDSDLDNVTLANGTSGQIKHIYCVVEGNAADTWKITPATMLGGTQITFAGVGEGCTLVFADNEGWTVVGNNGGTIA